MKNIYSDEGVRKRLILSALDELCLHGMEDFSLRRVAISSQVSCAAPYRHFKSKEELIVETAKYITSKWQLLADEIIAVHKNDAARTLSELAVAAAKFWISNGKFRSLLIPDKNSPIAEEMKNFDTPIINAARAYFEERGELDDAREGKIIRILAAVYGCVLLSAAGKLSAALAAECVRTEISTIL